MNRLARLIGRYLRWLGDTPRGRFSWRLLLIWPTFVVMMAGALACLPFFVWDAVKKRRR